MFNNLAYFDTVNGDLWIPVGGTVPEAARHLVSDTTVNLSSPISTGHGRVLTATMLNLSAFVRLVNDPDYPRNSKDKPL